jgi:hypothetical protein
MIAGVAKSSRACSKLPEKCDTLIRLYLGQPLKRHPAGIERATRSRHAYLPNLALIEPEKHVHRRSRRARIIRRIQIVWCVLQPKFIAASSFHF